MARKSKEELNGVLIWFGDYALSSDPNNWMIIKMHKPKNKDPYPIPIKFYPRIEGAINGIVDLKLKECGATTLKELVDAIADIKKEIKEKLQ